MRDFLIAIASSFGTGTILFATFFWLYMKYPDNLKKIFSQIAFVLSYLFKRYEYFAIKNETEGKINSFVGSLRPKVDVDLPYVSIKWTGSENEPERIAHEDYETIIVMRDRKHRNKNFVHAAYFFMSEIFLKHSKRHLPKHLKTALDLFATKEILKQESAAAVEQFVADYMSPEIEKSDDVREYLKKFNLIEKLGVFFPIFIQELSLLGRKVFLEKKSQEVINEVKDLIGFLEEWSNRRTGQLTREIFIGNYMKCAIKIVASQVARDNNSINSQRGRILHAINIGCENVYAVGRIDDGNKQFMDDVLEKVLNERKDLEIKRKLSFPAKIKKANGEEINSHDYFFHIHNPKAVRSIIED